MSKEESATPLENPDDVFIDIILEAAEPDLSKELEWLWDRAMRIQTAGHSAS